MPQKVRPKTAPIDPTPSNPKNTPPSVVSLKTDEINETNNQTNVVPKKKTVKKVVKIVVKKLVKRRVPKVGLNKKSKVVENEGSAGIESGLRGIDGIGEMGCVENCVGGNGLVENDGKIDSLVLNSSFGGGSCDFDRNVQNLGEESKLGVIEGFHREGRNGLVENVRNIESLVSNSDFGGESGGFGGNLNNEGNFGVIQDFVDYGSCDFGGNLDKGGSVSEDIGNSGVIHGFQGEEGNRLVEDVGKIGSIASDSVIYEGVEDSVHGSSSLGLMEAGNIGLNSIHEGESCDVGVSTLMEEGIPVEVENFGGMEAVAVEGSGNVDSSVSDLVVENKFCDLDVMEVENEGILGTSEKEKEGLASGDQVDGEEDQSMIVKSEIAGEKSSENEGNEVQVERIKEKGEKEEMNKRQVDGEEDQSMIVKSEIAGEKSSENEGLVEGKSDEFRNEIQVERSKEKGEKEEMNKRNGGKMGNVGNVSSAELEVMERLRRMKTEIFIGGVERNATKEDVRKAFEEVGEIIEVRMWINEKTGKNKGYAFVRFASAVDAKKALETHPKVEICGKQCSVAPLERDTISLGNINKKWKNDDVIKLLKDREIQKINKVSVMVDPKNVEHNRGFAFVQFQTHLDAKTAFTKLQKDLPVKLQNLKLAWAEPLNEPDGEEAQKVKTVYVDYLPSSWNEEKVRNCFERFGEIENVVLAQNLHSSRRKDFAFVNFVTREAALACIESFNHGMVDDEGTEVYVKVSIAKTSPKGKSLKKVSTSTSLETSKQKLKAVERITKPTQARNKQAATAHTNKAVAEAEYVRRIEHGNKRGRANQNSSDRVIDMRIRDTAVDARTSHSVVDSRTLHSTDIEQILAERALQRQIRSRLGLTNSNHSSVSPGSKRPFSASTGDLYNPESIRHTRLRVESSFPFGSENMVGDDPYHLVPRVHNHLHAESSFPLVNRSLQADYPYHPDARGNIPVHAENSFPVRNPKMQGDDLFLLDHRMYPRVGAETGADDPYRHDPRGHAHALVFGEKSFPGRSQNFQADDLLHQVPLRFSNVHAENTLPSGSLGRSEASPGLRMPFPYPRRSPDFASASDYRAGDYANSFQMEAPIGGSSSILQKTWKK